MGGGIPCPWSWLGGGTGQPQGGSWAVESGKPLWLEPQLCAGHSTQAVLVFESPFWSPVARSCVSHTPRASGRHQVRKAKDGDSVGCPPRSPQRPQPQGGPPRSPQRPQPQGGPLRSPQHPQPQCPGRGIEQSPLGRVACVTGSLIAVGSEASCRGGHPTAPAEEDQLRAQGL